MKKFILLLFSLFIFSLFSCGGTSTFEAKEQSSLQNITVSTFKAGSVFSASSQVQISFKLEDSSINPPTKVSAAILPYGENKDAAIEQKKYLLVKELSQFYPEDKVPTAAEVSEILSGKKSGAQNAGEKVLFDTKPVDSKQTNEATSEFAVQETEVAQIELSAEAKLGGEVAVSEAEIESINETIDNDNGVEKVELTSSEKITTFASQGKVTEVEAADKTDSVAAQIDPTQTQTLDDSFNIDFPLTFKNEGLYKLAISFFDEDKLIGTKYVPFFFSEREVGIASVEVLPSVLYPEGEGIVLVNYSSKTSAQAFARVYFQNKLIASDKVKNIGRHILINAPKEEGFYPFYIELFPFSFDEIAKGSKLSSSDYKFNSPYSVNMNLLVSKKNNHSGSDFIDNNNYSELFHFNGELNNWATADSKKETPKIKKITLDGKPTLEAKDGFFGYNFKKGSALTFDYFPLPCETSHSGGAGLQSFTLEISAQFLAGQEAVLFEAKSGRFTFSLVKDENLRPMAIFDDGTHRYEIKVPASFDNSTLLSRRLTLIYDNFYLDTFKYSIRLYSGNQFLCEEIIGQTFYSLAKDGSGTATLGDLNGESGIIDEFGIYLYDDEGKRSIKQGFFDRALSEKNSADVVYSNDYKDFDLFTNYDYSYSPGVSPAKPGAVIGNDLVLVSNCECCGGGGDLDWTRFCLGEFSLDSKRLNFSIDISSKKPKGEISLYSVINSAQINFLKFDLYSGEVILDGDKKIATVGDTGVIAFSLIREEEGVFFELAGKKFYSEEITRRNLAKGIFNIEISNNYDSDADETRPIKLHSYIIDKGSRPTRWHDFRENIVSLSNE